MYSSEKINYKGKKFSVTEESLFLLPQTGIITWVLVSAGKKENQKELTL